MKSKVYTKCSFIMVALLAASVNLFSQITGPTPVCEGTTGVSYTGPTGWTTYNWTVYERNHLCYRSQHRRNYRRLDCPGASDHHCQ